MPGHNTARSDRRGSQNEAPRAAQAGPGTIDSEQSGVLLCRLHVLRLACATVEVQRVQHLVGYDLHVEAEYVALAELGKRFHVEVEVLGQLDQYFSLPDNRGKLLLCGNSVVAPAELDEVLAIEAEAASHSQAAPARPRGREDADYEQGVVGELTRCLEEILKLLPLLRFFEEAEQEVVAGIEAHEL